MQTLAAATGAPLVPPALAAIRDVARRHGGVAKTTGAGGGDGLPVEAGECAGPDIPVAHPLELQRRPRPQDPGCDLLRIFSDRDR